MCDSDDLWECGVTVMTCGSVVCDSDDQWECGV